MYLLLRNDLTLVFGSNSSLWFFENVLKSVISDYIHRYQQCVWHMDMQ